jgi:hypothetical protein
MSRSTRHPHRPRRARRPVEPASPTLAANLAALAEMIDRSAEDGPEPIPTLVQASPVAGGASFDLGFKALTDGESVVSALCGFRAPADWHVLGVLTGGNAFAMAPHHQRRPRGRMRLVHLVHRSGTSASVLRAPDGEPTVSTHPPEGRIDDYCRRALGIATPAPDHTSIELWALHWLGAVIDAVPSTWAEVAALHPAIVLAVTQPASDGLPAVESLVELGNAFASVAGWEHLRRECAKGHIQLPDMPRSLAIWHDEGSFSRDVLGEWPSVAELAASAIDVLPTKTAALLADALVAWELWGGPNETTRG